MLLFFKTISAQSVGESERQAIQSAVSFEISGLYSMDIRSGLVKSNGFGTRAAALFLPQRKLRIGLVVDWRIIPGIIERSFTNEFSNLFNSSLLTYHGDDSLSMYQLRRILSKEENLHFTGFIKGAVGIAWDYQFIKSNSIRCTFGLINKQFRTVGNDTLSNTYGDPGYFWLNSGKGYFARFETLLFLKKFHVKEKWVGLKLTLGYEYGYSLYSKASYNDINLFENLGINQSQKQKKAISNAIFFGFCLSGW